MLSLEMLPGMGTRIGRHLALVFSLLLVVSGGAAIAASTATSTSVATNTSPSPSALSAVQVGNYKVSIKNVTVRTWALRNTTVDNATIDTVHVGTLRTKQGTKRNVILHNVSVSTVHIRNGTLKNVSADRIVIRNRSIWNVPGGDLFDPGVKNRVIERHVLANLTVEGAAIDTLNVTTLSTADVTVPEQSTDPQVDPAVTNPDSKPRPDIVIENASVDSGVVRHANAGSWSTRSISSENGRTRNKTSSAPR